MHEQPQIEIPGEPPSARGPFNFALMVAAAAVIIVLAGFYLWPGRQSPSRGGTQQVHPPFGPEERAYAAGKIGFAFHVPAVARFGPAFVAAAGYFALAWIERSWMVAAISFALFAVTAAIIGFDLSSQESKALVFGLYGMTLLAVGFSLRMGRKIL